MKISTEQLRALQEQKLQRGKQQQEGFTNILARQLETDGETSPAVAEKSAAPTDAMLMKLVGISEDSTVDAAFSLDEELKAASVFMEGMFDSLDDYTRQIAGNQPTALKEAYSLLSSMDSRIAEFEERFSGTLAEQPELTGMFNEIRVLATTEMFKFNRGDYT